MIDKGLAGYKSHRPTVPPAGKPVTCADHLGEALLYHSALFLLTPKKEMRERSV